MASWIKAEYRPFVKMCQGLYETPYSEVSSYSLNSELTSSRIAVYTNGNSNVLVLRGTSLNKSDKTLDVADDLVIASNYGQTSLEKEGKKILDKLNGSTILTGHSLGGYAALKLAKENNLKCCAFNPGTSPKNPITEGPGKDGIVYHIVGDVLSAYISDAACEVIRVDMGLSPLDTLYAHSLDRFEGGDKVYGFLTGEQEQIIMQGTNALLQTGYNIVADVSTGSSFEDAMRNITSIMSNDIPGIADDIILGVAEFLGVAALGKGLIAFKKAKTPGQKVQAVISTLSDEKVQKILKEKGAKGLSFLQGAKKSLSEKVTQLLSKKKHFPQAVKIPKKVSEKEVAQLYQKAKSLMNIDKKQLSKAIVKHVDKPPSYFEAVMKDAPPKYENPPAYVKQKSALKRPGEAEAGPRKKVIISSKKDFNPFEKPAPTKKYQKEAYPKKIPAVNAKTPTLVAPKPIKPIAKPLPSIPVKPPANKPVLPPIKSTPVSKPIVPKTNLPSMKKPISTIKNTVKGVGSIIKAKVPPVKKPPIKRPFIKFK
jgi:hypothetical protein